MGSAVVRRVGRGLGVAVVLTASVAVGGAPSAAQDVPVNRDFATEVLGDAWDFANAEDALLAEGPPVSLYVTDAGFGDGTYDFTSDGGFVDLHQMTVPGALPDSRDGVWNPVDADTYTHVSLRLHASRRGPFRVGWFTCTTDYSPCFAFHDFTVEQGWGTYTLPMPQRSSAWTGSLYGIRLASGPPATRFRLDWFRIHTADSSPTPVDGAPAPKVLVPDASGDEDFATTVLGNPWDLADAADVIGVANVSGGRVEDGQYVGTNGPPVQNNPYLLFSAGPGLDPERYHLLTVTTTYDGPFSLEDAPGGGMHGRWLFRRADTGAPYHDSRELVTFRSRPTATYDLREGRFGSTVEPGFAAWTGSTITGLRWDVNEDRGARSWRLDEITLTARHRADGLFEVAWEDRDHRDGTVVDIGVARERGAVGAARAVGLVQQPGTNRALVDLTDVPPGPHWVWVRATAPDGIVTTTWASGELDVSGRIAGPDRVATGVALSRLGWAEGAQALVVASARDFPDALAGVQLADAVDGPLLLTDPDRVPDVLAAEVVRLAPSEVLVLGGARAVSPAVLARLEQLTGTAPQRVAGADRYETAARIAVLAEERWVADGAVATDEVVLASGAAFPDALAAGPFASGTRRPLLLTVPDRLPRATREALEARPDSDVAIVGGTAAVSAAVEASLGRSTRRIAGDDRYETARRLAVERAAVVDVRDRTLLASGASFPDALGAGALVAHTGEALLLTAPTSLPAPTASWLASSAARRALVVGGRAAVDQPTVEAAHAAARG